MISIVACSRQTERGTEAKPSLALPGPWQNSGVVMPLINDSTEYIARISYGKDSLKMLDVIHSRGLPLDRITTTDVWATDTISANLPPVEEFKARMDERIFQLYGIRVEHLCARNPDGSKKTYEQMFYHVPVRRSQTLNVERAGSGREQSVDSPTCGTVQDGNNPWIPRPVEPLVSVRPQADCLCTGCKDNHRIPTKHPVQLVPKNSKFHPGTGIKGWPLSNKRLQWCQHLKTRVSTDFRHYGFRGAGVDSKSTCDKTPFLLSAALQRAKTEILWNTLALLQTNPSASVS